ncbi:MAG: membrane protein insertase YidC, partial [Actinomycetota bacterium]|nr:membrane protein insertase YidC [Actinomycetota bacterium]
LIYWSTTNFWTWGQQFYVIKRNPTPGSPAFEELERKRAKKKGEVIPPEGTTVIDEANSEEVKGQRSQPKKKKKRKKP